MRRPPAVPDWFVRTWDRGAAPVPVHDVIRSAVTVPAVMVVAYAGWGAGVAVFASLSALLIVLSERGGTTGQRLLRSGVGLSAGILAQCLGLLTAGTGVVPLLAVLAFGLLSGLMSGVTSGLSWAAMQLIVQMAIAGGLQIPLALPDRVAAYVIGGAAALGGMLLQSALERTDRHYARSLDNAQASLDSWRATNGEDRRRARAAANRDLVAAAALILVARPFRARRRRLIRDARRRLTAIAAAGQELDQSLPPGSVSRTPIASIPAGRILRHGLTSRETWSFVLRLEACLAVGELVRQLTPFGHSYWILLTIGLTLKPDVQSVLSRTLQRAGGTLLGVGLAWVPPLLSPGYAIFPMIAALSAPIPWSVRRNYAIFCILVTPLVLLILDFGGPVGLDVVLQRIVNTATGCVIVIVIGYLLWPTTWRPPISRWVSPAKGAAERYAEADPRSADAVEARLELLARTAELRERVALASPEPSRVRRRVAVVADTADLLDAPPDTDRHSS